MCPETHLFLPCFSDSFRLTWCHEVLRSLDEEEDTLPQYSAGLNSKEFIVNGCDAA